MDTLFEYLLFLGETITVVVAIAIIIGLIANTAMRAKEMATGEHIEVKKLNDRYQNMQDTLQDNMISPAEAKALKKARKKEEKAKQKAQKAALKTAKPEDNDDTEEKRRIFVIDFDGDLRASGVEGLSEEVTSILTVAKEGDEVLIKLESPGGMVHGYGLAASQLQRIRDRNIKLTASVDKVAASGGYLMACVADQIIAAPFAIIGSIGVVAQLPNFNKLLKKHNIEYETLTAGEHKRTLTLFGKNTPEGREKMQSELEEVHVLFKSFVQKYRPDVNINQVATGEHWHAVQTVDMKLVDELKTSDDYLLAQRDDADIFSVKFVAKKSLSDKLGGVIQSSIERVLHARAF